MLIKKRRIVDVAGKEGEELGLGLTLAMSLQRGVAPRVSRRLLLRFLYPGRTRHLPFLTAEMPA